MEPIQQNDDEDETPIEQKSNVEVNINDDNDNYNAMNDSDNDKGLQQIKQILKWMEDGQKKICKADAIIICGDFNATPDSEVYETMIKKGYKSVVMENSGKEEWTFPTKTWRYSRTEEDDEPDDEVMTKDYIWIKSTTPVNINDVRLVGRQPIDSTHKGDDIQICPSDHLGIYCSISI